MPKINIHHNTVNNTVEVEVELYSQSAQGAKEKYLTSDILKLLGEEISNKVINVLKNDMVCNYQEGSLKGKWIFQLNPIPSQKEKDVFITETEVKENIVEEVKKNKKLKKVNSE